MLVKVDNQPINSRHGDAWWLTDFITVRNPDVLLKYQALTQGISDPLQVITRLWQYVANLPYKEIIHSSLSAGGHTAGQPDTWFFPAETIKVRQSNCANKSFLMASLLKNLLPQEGEVFVVLGRYTGDGVGGHAWIQTRFYGQTYYIETTQPRLSSPLITPEKATKYQPQLLFDQHAVYMGGRTLSAVDVLNQRFGVCAQPFLEKYLCEHCLALKGV
jgi:hypothetical protein